MSRVTLEHEACGAPADVDYHMTDVDDLRQVIAMRQPELFDPLTGTWSATTPMPIHVAAPTSALMPDGRVLVAGGSDAAGQPMTSTQLYDPTTASWSIEAPMHTGRDSSIAVPMPGGPVLVIGGLGAGGAALPSTEIYAQGGGS